MLMLIDQDLRHGLMYEIHNNEGPLMSREFPLKRGSPGSPGLKSSRTTPLV